MLLFFSIQFPQYMLIQFKGVGAFFGHNDIFLTLASSLALVFNAFSRLITGMIVDRVSFRYYFSILMTASIFFSATFSFAAPNSVLFIIYLCAANYIYGSVYVSLPTFYALTFGPEIGSYLYSYCFTASCFSTLTISLIIYEVQ